MICSDCAWEADSVKAGELAHDDLKLLNEQIGHACCRGGGWCDCRHKPVGHCIPVEEN